MVCAKNLYLENSIFQSFLEVFSVSILQQLTHILNRVITFSLDTKKRLFGKLSILSAPSGMGRNKQFLVGI